MTAGGARRERKKSRDTSRADTALTEEVAIRQLRELSWAAESHVQGHGLGSVSAHKLIKDNKESEGMSSTVRTLRESNVGVSW